MNGLLAAVIIVFTSLGVIFILGVISAIPVFFLWNWLMPLLFNLPSVTFFQAMGLSILCSCLFKNTVTSTKKDK